jgi:hypothetical protein
MIVFGEERHVMCEKRVLIERNVIAIRERIAAAAARVGCDAARVLLLPVTKSVGLEEVRILRELGFVEFAENRFEVAAPKIAALGEGVRWHLIGNLQRRKVRNAVPLFHFVDAVDRLELAGALEARCAELDRVMPVLIEMNVSGEASKHGFSAEELEGALEHIAGLPHLEARGLLTMAPFDAPESELHSVFGTLRGLAERHGLPELSMGMSDDFEIAVEEGATQVRIGRALFD